MNGERATESRIAAKILALLRETGRFKRVSKGEAIKGKGISAVLGWDNSTAPWAQTVPDLIVASDNHQKEPDSVFLLAIEMKYFPKYDLSCKRNWRQSFREIGQPLRDLLYGFDAVVLWHVFAEDIADSEIMSYSGMCRNVIDKLKLSVVYFATKFTAQNQFEFFQPWQWDKNIPLPPVQHVADCLLHINAQRCGSYRTKMNPLLEDKETLAMRQAVKSVLRIP